MGRPNDVGRIGRPLPEHGEVEVQELAHATQRVLDLAVQLAGGALDESRRDLGEEGLEREAVFGHRFGDGFGMQPLHGSRTIEVQRPGGRPPFERVGDRILHPPATARPTPKHPLGALVGFAAS